MNKYIFSLCCLCVFSAVSLASHAAPPSTAFKKPSYVGKNIKDDQAKEMMESLLDDIYKLYGVDGLRQLNEAKTRDELIIILGTMKDSTVAQDMVKEALPTRINNKVTGATGTGKLDGIIVEDTVFDQIEAGVLEIDWGIQNDIQACDIHCLPCCPC